MHWSSSSNVSMCFDTSCFDRTLYFWCKSLYLQFWKAISWYLFKCCLSSSSLGFPGASDGKESACNAGDMGLIPRSEDLLEKGIATHSSILAWRIPWAEEPGGLRSTSSQRVGHDWADFTSFILFTSRPITPVRRGETLGSGSTCLTCFLVFYSELISRKYCFPSGRFWFHDHLHPSPRDFPRLGEALL